MIRQTSATAKHLAAISVVAALAGCAGNVSEPPTASDTSASRLVEESSEPVVEESSDLVVEESSEPVAAAGWTPPALPISFRVTSGEGWSYAINLTSMPWLSASSYVDQSPPGKARVQLTSSGNSTMGGDIESLDEGRQAPDVTVRVMGYVKAIPAPPGNKNELGDVEAPGEQIGFPTTCERLLLDDSWILRCRNVGSLWTGDALPTYGFHEGSSPEASEEDVEAFITQLEGPFEKLWIEVNVHESGDYWKDIMCLDAESGETTTGCLPGF